MLTRPVSSVWNDGSGVRTSWGLLLAASRLAKLALESVELPALRASVTCVAPAAFWAATYELTSHSHHWSVLLLYVTVSVSRAVVPVVGRLFQVIPVSVQVLSV